MSTRLQVVLDDGEIRELRRIAKRNRMTLSEWVRQALRNARNQEPSGSAETRIAHVRAAVQLSFPTAEIDQMLAEIEQGYVSSSQG